MRVGREVVVFLALVQKDLLGVRVESRLEDARRVGVFLVEFHSVIELPLVDAFGTHQVVDGEVLLLAIVLVVFLCQESRTRLEVSVVLSSVSSPRQRVACLALILIVSIGDIIGERFDLASHPCNGSSRELDFLIRVRVVPTPSLVINCYPDDIYPVIQSPLLHLIVQGMDHGLLLRCQAFLLRLSLLLELSESSGPGAPMLAAGEHELKRKD